MNSGRSESFCIRHLKSRFYKLVDRIVSPDIVEAMLISHALRRGF